MANKKVSKGPGVGTAVAVTAGIAALSAGAYLLFGPDGKKNQKKAKAWMVRMKADVMEKMEKAEHVTAPIYHSIVDGVEKKYAAMKNLDTAEVAAEIKNLKKTWSKMTSGGKKAVKKAVKKSGVKKATTKK